MDNQCDIASLSLQALQTESHAVRLSVQVMLATAALVFVTSHLSKNYGQVDKLWSISPVIYAWILAIDARTILLATVVTIWGARLTWNFHRRGGYAWPPWDGDEDYRWAHMRRGTHVPFLDNDVIWIIFNFTFISLYQNILLHLLVAPAVVAHVLAEQPQCREPLNVYDIVSAVVVVAAVVVETLADNQQYAFQTEKYRRIHAKEPLDGEYKDGYCQSGLFAILRKPNYAADQVIWIAVYGFAIAAGNGFVNWSIAGCVLMCLMFQNSSALTETITSEKYPSYAQYMKRVPLFIPTGLIFPARKAKTG